MTIHSYKDIEIKNALVILSFPTIGMISNIVSNFVIKTLDLDLIGAVISDKFQPASIIKDGSPAPPVRIYAGDHICGPDGECDQIIVIASDLPIEIELLAPLADTILKWCQDNKVENIVTIEGINSEDLELGEEAKVYHVTSTNESYKFIEGFNSEELENGMVSGLSGVILWKGNLLKFPIVSLLAEAHQKFPDSRSASSVLVALDKMLPEIDMDPEPLLEKAEKIEAQIRNALSQMGQKNQKSVGTAAQGYFA